MKKNFSNLVIAALTVLLIFIHLSAAGSLVWKQGACWKYSVGVQRGRFGRDYESRAVVVQLRVVSVQPGDTVLKLSRFGIVQQTGHVYHMLNDSVTTTPAGLDSLRFGKENEVYATTDYFFCSPAWEPNDRDKLVKEGLGKFNGVAISYRIYMSNMRWLGFLEDEEATVIDTIGLFYHRGSYSGDAAFSRDTVQLISYNNQPVVFTSIKCRSSAAEPLAKLHSSTLLVPDFHSPGLTTGSC